MKIKNIFMILVLSIMLLYCIGAIGAVSDDIISELDSNDGIVIDGGNDELNSASDAPIDKEINSLDDIGSSNELNAESIDSEENIKTFGDLQKVIDESGENDTIEINGVYKSISSSTIKIQKDLTIDGASNTSFILSYATFDIHSKATFKNLNFTVCGNGLTFSNNATFINCHFFSNPDNSNSNYKFNNVTFINSYFNGSLLNVLVGGNGTFNNCTFENIFDMDWYNYDDVAFLNCSFINNGNIEVVGAAVVNCSFISNDGAQCYGNAVVNCSFINNKGLEVSIIDCLTDCKFINNTRVNSTGALVSVYSGVDFFASYGYAIYMTVLIKNCEFYNNGEENCWYGMIFVGNEREYVYKNLIIENCSFVDNKGNHLIYGNLDSYKINITLINLTLKNNTNYHYPGKFIYYDGLNITIINGDRINSYAKPIGYMGYLFDENFNAELLKAKLSLTSDILITSYNSGKSLVIRSSCRGFPADVVYILEIKINGKVKRFQIQSDGYFGYFEPGTLLNVGTYYGTIYLKETMYDYVPAKSTIKITKARTIVKAPIVISKFRQSKYFKVVLYDALTKKVLKNVAIKVKVFTGKKYRIYTLKSNSKGFAVLNTKILSVGTHKVLIYSGNSNYAISATSKIVIRR